jgi:hypothetical protein
MITVEQVIERMRGALGAPWNEKDRIAAGSGDTPVSGIVTTYAPTLEVLRKAVAAGRNLIVSREAPYWAHELYGRAYDAPGAELAAKTPTYAIKQQYIEEHKLVVLQFSLGWDARKTNGQVRGLANALGWGRYSQSPAKHDAERYGPGDVYFKLPSTTARKLGLDIAARLKVRGIRVIGAPETPVSKAALAPGLMLVPDVRQILKEPGVDAIIGGEPVEWEAGPYFDDVIASGQRKTLILLGQQASAEPGSGEVAAWLKPLAPEVPVEWVPAGEPFWIVRDKKGAEG